MAKRQDDNPFEMRRRKPPEEEEGGYQDTSIDDAERDFGMRDEQEDEEDYDLDMTVFTGEDGRSYYWEGGKKRYFDKAGRQINLRRWQKLREVFKEIKGLGIRKKDNHTLFQKSSINLNPSGHQIPRYDGKDVYYKRAGGKEWLFYKQWSEKNTQ